MASRSSPAEEERERASRARDRTLADSTFHGILHVAPDWTTLYANRAVARILGVEDPASLVGKDCRSFFPPDHASRIEAGVADTGNAEVDVVDAHGVRRRLLLRFEPTTDEQGRPHGRVGVVLDLTEMRRAEADKLRMTRRLDQAQRLESLGLLAGGVAHDFNNLLTGILGNADLLLMRLEVTSPLRRIVESIEEAGLRAAQLTAQMLAYSGHGRFLVETVDLSRLVNEMSGLLRSSVSKKARLDLRLAPDLAKIVADPAQLRQVLLSIVINASEALGEKEGSIIVSTGVAQPDADVLSEAWPKDTLSQGRFAWLEVADTGCGMDAATQPRIFDPFFSTKGMGRGMGLSAVLGIVRGHRGGVQVESALGQGTTMRVLLPVLEGEQAPPPTAFPETRAGTASKTILVVDDEELVRTLSRSVLEESGFRVFTAVDGMDALQVVRKHREEIALVVLDLTMPRMGGEEAFREIRKLRADLPVILCSGYSESEGASAIGGRDQAAFLHKPFRAADLLRTVRNLLPPT